MLFDWPASIDYVLTDRSRAVDQISIGVVLDVEAVLNLVPVIENLASKNMPANSPAEGIVLLQQV